MKVRAQSSYIKQYFDANCYFAKSVSEIMAAI